MQATTNWLCDPRRNNGQSMESNSVSKQKVVSLIRVSSEQQAADDRTGIQRQLEDIGIHCRSHNLEVIEEYLPGR
jgi:hypothetical protein